MCAMNEIDRYRAVERALIFIDQNTSRSVSLGEVARHVGLSEFHFHRLFSRWAGTTPDRFFRYLKKEYLKKLLAASEESLLHTAYRGGLSNPSRLHDLFVTYEAMTPGQLRSRGEGVEVRCGIHPSPYGMCFIAVTDRGILEMRFLEDKSDKDESRSEVPNPAAELEKEFPNSVFIPDPEMTAGLVERVFTIRDSGSRSCFGEKPLHLLIRGTNFQIKVWEALLRIPPGRIVSYGTVARLLGVPGSSRAVGRAVGENKIAYLIPCHRVIRRIGAAGEYRWGKYRKRAILGREIACEITDDEETVRENGT